MTGTGVTEVLRALRAAIAGPPSAAEGKEKAAAPWQP